MRPIAVPGCSARRSSAIARGGIAAAAARRVVDCGAGVGVGDGLSAGRGAVGVGSRGGVGTAVVFGWVFSGGVGVLWAAARATRTGFGSGIRARRVLRNLLVELAVLVYVAMGATWRRARCGSQAYRGRIEELMPWVLGWALVAGIVALALRAWSGACRDAAALAVAVDRYAAMCCCCWRFCPLAIVLCVCGGGGARSASDRRARIRGAGSGESVGT